MVDRKRHLAKAVTYRVFGSATTAAIAYVVTGNTGLSVTVGVADTLLKIGLYYLHERVWYRVKWGVHGENTCARQEKAAARPETWAGGAVAVSSGAVERETVGTRG